MISSTNISTHVSNLLCSGNVPLKYKYEILNVKGNPYYPIKNRIHKSRNNGMYNSNTTGNKSVVAGTGLSNSLIPGSYTNS